MYPQFHSFGPAQEHRWGLRCTSVNCSPHLWISSFFPTTLWYSSYITAGNSTCHSPGPFYSHTWVWPQGILIPPPDTAVPLSSEHSEPPCFVKEARPQRFEGANPFPSRFTLSSKKLKCTSEVTGWWSQKDSTICDLQGRHDNVPELEFPHRSCNSLPLPS